MPPPRPRVEIDPLALMNHREDGGHSKTALARLAGVSVGYVCDLEHGRRKGNPVIISKLAKALKVHRSALEKSREEAA